MCYIISIFDIRDLAKPALLEIIHVEANTKSDANSEAHDFTKREYPEVRSALDTRSA